MTSNALLVHNTFSKRNFVNVAKSITKQYEENMKKICEVCEDSGFRIQYADDESNIVFPLKLSRSRSINGSPGLRSGDTQSMRIDLKLSS